MLGKHSGRGVHLCGCVSAMVPWALVPQVATGAGVWLGVGECVKVIGGGGGGGGGGGVHRRGALREMEGARERGG